MIVRTLTLAAGLTGAATSSQFPEFSQQYVQRLGGAVDALAEVVTNFDSSAAAEGLTRQEALEQMMGSEFVARRRSDMETTFARYDTLRTTLTKIETAGPFTRAYRASGSGVDTEVAKATWRAFEPAVPLNFAGLMFAGFGFFASALSFGAIIFLFRGCLRMIFRSSKQVS